jgi:hypothetical protein
MCPQGARGRAAIGAVVAAAAALLAFASPAFGAGVGQTAGGSERARLQLISLLDNVRSATGKSYKTRDSTGYTVDTIKIVQLGARHYLGVYHVNQSGLFSVRAATSRDLIHWQFVAVLEPNASQPTITQLSDGNYLVAYEKLAPGGASHLEFRVYPDMPGIQLHLFTAQFDAPATLSSVAEGTPSIHDATMDPITGRSRIDVGFHYYDSGLGVDRNAQGTLTNFSTWTSSVATDIDNDLRVGGSIGSRYSFSFRGYPFTLIEAQQIAGEWSTWQIFLYDETTKTIARVQPRTDAGSFSFANPAATVISDPAGHRALLATGFIPQQGAAAGEAGPLVYWNEF